MTNTEQIPNSKPRPIWNFILEVAKLSPLISACLAIVVLCIITCPTSKFNEWISGNNNKRQQANLLIDLFKEDDVSKLTNGYEIILATQGAIDSTIDTAKIRILFEQRVFEREKSALIDKYTDLLIKKIEIDKKYNNIPGVGEAVIGESLVVAPDITFLQNFISQQLKEIEKQLKAHGVNLKEIKYYNEYSKFMK